MKNSENKNRCDWALSSDIEREYHDSEWGIPIYDSSKLYEMLTLESFQSGLSWHTILAKRENFRNAFDNFDYNKVAKYSEDRIGELLQDAGIVRHRGKIEAAINNAKVIIEMESNGENFSDYIWSFTDEKQIVNKYSKMSDLPSKTELSEKISKELKKRGIKFFGATTCYSFMQAVGMVNDHLDYCSFK